VKMAVFWNIAPSSLVQFVQDYVAYDLKIQQFSYIAGVWQQSFEALLTKRTTEKVTS
jgi:hypothetical protein